MPTWSIFRQSLHRAHRHRQRRHQHEPQGHRHPCRQHRRKGDVLGTARIAAIQAAKQTGFLIPLCHPIALNHIRVDFDIDKDLARVKATVTASTEGQTGVEMER